MKIVIDGKVIAETGDVESIEFVTAGHEPEPAPTPEPDPAPEPHPDPTQVVTGYHITTWPGESGREIRIPQGKILASRFVTGEGNHGQFSFEAAAGQYHATDVWISRTPGGNPIDDPRASQQGVSFIYSLRWAEFDNRYRASLQPHTTYYINLRHADPQAPTSTVYRYIK